VSWYGVFTPKGVPKTVIDRLSAEIQKVVNSKDYQEKLALQGAEAVSGITPTQFDKIVRDELVMWGKVVNDSRAKID
jgi:tripartite-type tricarboxylate transporter receptor subunit TctC